MELRIDLAREVDGEELLNRLRAALPAAVNRVSRELAESVSAKAVEVMQRGIYDHPIPKGKNGEPLWERTGKLKAAERAEVVPFAGDVGGFDLMNPVASEKGFRYAPARDALGRPGERQPVHTKPVHWQEDAVKEKQAEIEARYTEALEEALREAAQ